jgi:TIR domain
MSFDVFIRYSTRDSTVAKAACAALEVGKIRCWIAPRDILPGAPWGASIVRAIDRCRVMVLIFSANANDSRQVHREVNRAFSKCVAVVPLRIENVEPGDELAYYLDTVHWLDALTPPLERRLEQLTAAVRALLAATEPGTPSGETVLDANVYVMMLRSTV